MPAVVAATYSRISAVFPGPSELPASPEVAVPPQSREPAAAPVPPTARFRRGGAGRAVAESSVRNDGATYTTYPCSHGLTHSRTPWGMVDVRITRIIPAS